MSSHADLIRSLGGGTAVAQAARARGVRLDRNRVYRWLYDDNVPWRWRPLIAELAGSADLPVPDGFLMPAPMAAESEVEAHDASDAPTGESSKRNTDEQSVNARAADGNGDDKNAPPASIEAEDPEAGRPGAAPVPPASDVAPSGAAVAGNDGDEIPAGAGGEDEEAA